MAQSPQNRGTAAFHQGWPESGERAAEARRQLRPQGNVLHAGDPVQPLGRSASEAADPRGHPEAEVGVGAVLHGEASRQRIGSRDRRAEVPADHHAGRGHDGPPQEFHLAAQHGQGPGAPPPAGEPEPPPGIVHGKVEVGDPLVVPGEVGVLHVLPAEPRVQGEAPHLAHKGVGDLPTDAASRGCGPRGDGGAGTPGTRWVWHGAPPVGRQRPPSPTVGAALRPYRVMSQETPNSSRARARRGSHGPGGRGSPDGNA